MGVGVYVYSYLGVCDGRRLYRDKTKLDPKVLDVSAEHERSRRPSRSSVLLLIFLVLILISIQPLTQG